MKEELRLLYVSNITLYTPLRYQLLAPIKFFYCYTRELATKVALSRCVQELIHRDIFFQTRANCKIMFEKLQ